MQQKKIRLYNESNKMKDVMFGLKGITYNFEQGKIVETKLKKSNSFDEEINKYWKYKKIAFPNVKVGSVIDLTYRIESPLITNIDDIYVQFSIPVKDFFAEVSTIDNFGFKRYQNPRSYLKLDVVESTKSKKIKWTQKEKSGFISQSISGFGEKDFKVNVVTITKQNVEALKDEEYVSNLNNYRAKLSWELLYSKLPNGQFKNYSTDWETIVEKIFEDENFGGQLTKSNYYKDDVDAIIDTSKTDEEKVEKILQLIRSRVKWNDTYGYYPEQGLKVAYKTGTGNVADINLMLVSMLKYAGISASPVLVSTKSNGIPLFPTRKGFNYVICAIEKQEKVDLYDATNLYSHKDVLPVRAINWQGMLMRDRGSYTWINLYPTTNSLTTSIIKAKISDDLVVDGNTTIQYKNHHSFKMNQNLTGKTDAEKSQFVKSYYENLEFSNLKVSDLINASVPVKASFDFTDEESVEEIGDKLYVTPLLFLSTNENPFKKENRNYPIDFSYSTRNRYIVSIKVPEGYKVESTPENIKVKLEENLGEFSYVVSNKNNTVNISYNFQINFPLVPVDYYKDLRLLYTKLYEKHSEKIVLSKI